MGFRAMDLANQFLESEGYRWKDVSPTEPFDLIAEKDSELVKVEVKGTTTSILATGERFKQSTVRKRRTTMMTGFRMIVNILTNNIAYLRQLHVFSEAKPWRIGHFFKFFYSAEHLNCICNCCRISINVTPAIFAKAGKVVSIKKGTSGNRTRDQHGCDQNGPQFSLPLSRFQTRASPKTKPREGRRDNQPHF